MEFQGGKKKQKEDQGYHGALRAVGEVHPSGSSLASLELHQISLRRALPKGCSLAEAMTKIAAKLHMKAKNRLGRVYSDSTNRNLAEHQQTTSKPTKVSRSNLSYKASQSLMERL